MRGMETQKGKTVSSKLIRDCLLSRTHNACDALTGNHKQDVSTCKWVFPPGEFLRSYSLHLSR